MSELTLFLGAVVSGQMRVRQGLPTSLLFPKSPIESGRSTLESIHRHSEDPLPYSAQNINSTHTLHTQSDYAEEYDCNGY